MQRSPRSAPRRALRNSKDRAAKQKATAAARKAKASTPEARAKRARARARKRWPEQVRAVGRGRKKRRARVAYGPYRRATVYDPRRGTRRPSYMTRKKGRLRRDPGVGHRRSDRREGLQDFRLVREGEGTDCKASQGCCRAR